MSEINWIYREYCQIPVHFQILYSFFFLFFFFLAQELWNTSSSFALELLIARKFIWIDSYSAFHHSYVWIVEKRREPSLQVLSHSITRQNKPSDTKLCKSRLFPSSPTRECLEVRLQSLTRTPCIHVMGTGGLQHHDMASEAVWAQAALQISSQMFRAIALVSAWQSLRDKRGWEQKLHRLYQEVPSNLDSSVIQKS